MDKERNCVSRTAAHAFTSHSSAKSVGLFTLAVTEVVKIVFNHYALALASLPILRRRESNTQPKTKEIIMMRLVA